MIYRHPSTPDLTQPLDTQLIHTPASPPPASVLSLSGTRGDADDVAGRPPTTHRHHPCSDRSAARMDRQEGDRKRAREGDSSAAAAAGRRRHQQQQQQHAPPADAVMEEVALEETAPAPAAGAGAGAAWQRPEGVFDFPWQKCRGGLGVASGGGGGWELRDVFFRSLVDGRTAAIGVPGDRLFPPPSKRTMFDDVDAWLAAAGDGEVDPLWRSVLEAGPRPAA